MPASESTPPDLGSEAVAGRGHSPAWRLPFPSAHAPRACANACPPDYKHLSGMTIRTAIRMDISGRSAH